MKNGVVGRVLDRWGGTVGLGSSRGWGMSSGEVA